jgi:hypothetical protein
MHPQRRAIRRFSAFWARLVACHRGFPVGMMEAQHIINRDEL